jgi:hypothetical protein
MNNKEKEKEKEEMLLNKYIDQLNDIEKKVLSIAIDHLETSFNLKKSIGFQKWMDMQSSSSASLSSASSHHDN